MSIILFWWTFIVAAIFMRKSSADDQLNFIGLERFDKVRLNEKNFERVRNMHVNWYAAGVKALMGKMGADLYRKLNRDEQLHLAQCLDHIEDKRDLVQSANCLVEARRIFLQRISADSLLSSTESENEPGSETRMMRGKRAISETKLAQKANTRTVTPELAKWKERLGKVWKKGKENKKSKWTMDRSALRPKFQVRQIGKLEKLADETDRSAIIRVSNLISKLVTNQTDIAEGGAKWTRMYDTLVRLKRANDKRMESPGAGVYEKRMYDLVLDRKTPSLGPESKTGPAGLVQLGLSLLRQLRPNGTSSPSSSDSNLKFMSPRFAPLMPDKSEAGKSVLSPTVLALYETEPKKGHKGTGGKALEIASMPEVLKATGMDEQDREALLQALMEVSGSIGHVQEAMELLKALNFFEIEPDIMDANDRILGAYTRMESSFDSEQEGDIDREGWTFLRHSQFDQLCRDQNAEFPEDLKANLAEFDGLDKRKREQAIWRRIERIARNIPDKIADRLDGRRRKNIERFHVDTKRRRRLRRQTTQEISWLSVLKPVILQPYMFTPIFGLSVLGPLVLSPNIFSPLILAPSVLSPYILSPAAPIPYILSPYVFGPFILSPMAMAPFILTPYVLSPNVLNPFVMAPLILSPTVLSPDILSPQALGGGILSPTVGSPAVLTESYLMASVLSPSVLSK